MIQYRTAAESEAWLEANLPQALPEVRPPGRRRVRGQRRPTKKAAAHRESVLTLVSRTSPDDLTPRKIARRLWRSTCPVCGVERSWADWYLRQRRDGTWATVGRCRPCSVLKRRERYRENSNYDLFRRRRLNQERAREARYRADPALAARRKAQKRASQIRRDKRKRDLRKVRRHSAQTKAAAGGHLPVGPFREWMLQRLDEYYRARAEEVADAKVADITGITLMAEVVGIDPRRLRAMLYDEQQYVRLDIVDSVTLRDGTSSLDELYPYEEPAPRYFKRAA